MSDQDQDLASQFQQQRLDDAARTPSFARILSRRAPARRRPWVPVLALGAAIMVIVSVFVARERPNPSKAPFTIAVGDLRMPTDFLLDVQSVPSIGRSDDWFPSLSESKGNPL
jgi:hypothetical protein